MSMSRVGPMVIGMSLAAMLAAPSANAITPTCGGCVQTTIAYDINNLQYDVTNIVVFGETNDGFIGQLGPFTASAGDSVITVNYGVTPPIVATFLMGVTTEISRESTGAVVLFTNDSFASTNTGQDFNTIFYDLVNSPIWYTDQGVSAGYKSIASESTPANGEATLVADLQAYTGPGPDLDLIHFSGGAAGYHGPSGQYLYGAMSRAGFVPGANFTAIAFSNGQVIGTGTSAVVPEPGAWSLMLIGFCGLGASLRGRRRAGLA